ncbi:MAG: hypothetical protein IMZ52_04735 [Actinobacteria bacterium]|nr:hypothetical protein [Actinomycetota bacterium]MBE3114771.1 hypothetical protein [Actinomycetota bacterium]
MKSKCCNARLINIDNPNCKHGLNGPELMEIIYRYCSKCGLTYHKIQKNLKLKEEIDEWE